jgi:hypothetical protein
MSRSDWTWIAHPNLVHQHAVRTAELGTADGIVEVGCGLRIRVTGYRGWRTDRPTPTRRCVKCDDTVSHDTPYYAS